MICNLWAWDSFDAQRTESHWEHSHAVFAKVLTLIFKIKKYLSTCLFPKSFCFQLCAQYYWSTIAPDSHSTSRNHRAPQSLPGHFLIITKDVAHPLSVTSPVSFLNYQEAPRIVTQFLSSESFLEIRGWHTTFCEPNPVLSAIFANKVLLECSHSHLFLYCLWLFSCYNGRIE